MRNSLPFGLVWLVGGCAVTAPGPVDEDTESDAGEESDTDTLRPTDDTDPGTETDTVLETDDTPAGTGASLAPGTDVVCGDPSVRTRDPYLRVTAKIRAPEFPYLAGGGSGAGDFDGDGQLEVVMVGHDAVYLGSATADALEGRIIHSIPTPADPTTGLFGALVWDADDDGDLDLYVSGMGVPGALLLNDGAAQFTEGAAAAGLTLSAGHHSGAASAADADSDGDLDLAIAGYGFVVEGGTPADFPPGDPTYLFLNDGSGHFTDATSRLPASASAGYTFVPAWLDADSDGDDDLYLVNDFGRSLDPNRLLLRSGDQFIEDTRNLGLDVRISSMGIGLGDLDGNGTEDLVMSDWGGLMGIVRQGPYWFDVTSSLIGFDTNPPRTVAWGSELADLDNDGDLDVFSTFGFVETTIGRQNRPEQPDMLLERLVDGSYRERAFDLGLADHAPHRGVSLVDLNGDGWLDIVRAGLDGVGRLDLAACGEASWSTVTLRQPAPNGFAVGATVRLSDGTRSWTRRVRAGGTSLGVGLPPVVHFGLGDATRVTVDITWPDGEQDRFLDVPTNRPLQIERP